MLVKTPATLSVLGMFLWVALPSVCQRWPGLPEKTVASIERIVTEEMSRQGIPGLSVAIGSESKLRWTAGYGYSDVENNVPAKASTVYRLASISKSITAVAAMQLAEQGKLDLDAPVRNYVPSFPEKPWPITTRQLLGHLGGIRHYREREFASTRHYTDLKEALKIFQQDDLIAEPGTKYNYTTYGYVLVGAVVEAASGEKFVDYIEKHIFEPAGMKTIQPDNVFTIIPNRTRGYQRDNHGRLLNCGLADTSYKIPGGGLVSTPADLVLFALAVYRGDLLKPTTVQEMWTAQTLTSGQKTSRGLGWFVTNWDGLKIVGHGGRQQGTATMLSLSPDKGVVVAVMSNLESAAVGVLSQRIMRVMVQ